MGAGAEAVHEPAAEEPEGAQGLVGGAGFGADLVGDAGGEHHEEGEQAAAHDEVTAGAEEGEGVGAGEVNLQAGAAAQAQQQPNEAEVLGDDAGPGGAGDATGRQGAEAEDERDIEEGR